MKVTEPLIKIREMQLRDIEQAMGLKNSEGWNQTEQDWEILLRLSPKTCLVAVSDQEVIGTVTAVNYSNELAWIGMMLVNEKYRRKGIGSLLLKDNIKRLKGCKIIKLDATPIGRNVYIQLGFEEEYTISRMTISPLPKQPITHSGTVTPLSSHDIQEIADLDKEVFGADRTDLIELILETYPDKALKLERDARIAAYCLRRDGVKHNHLGPVIALTTEDAKTLLAAAMSRLAGQAVVLDVPQKKKKFLKWLDSLGFQEHRTLVRMYYKNNYIPKQREREYAICGPELG
jgi:predicted N-acetyltransferase YhbS